MNESLMYLKKLEAVGVSRAQAEVTVEIMTDIIDKNLATKQDLLGARVDTAKEFALLRSDMSFGFAQAQSNLERMQDKVTIRLGLMLVAAVGVLAAVIKL